MRKLVKQFLYKRGYEIWRTSEAPPSLGAFLRSRDIDTVIDVGASTGQFAQGLRAHYFAGQIVSFEPVKEVFDELQRNAAGDKLWRTYNYGISNSARTASINVSELSVFSSLHAPNQAAIDFDTRARGIRTEQVTLKRLDELTDTIGGKKLFLKIDVQGHEREALDGAAGLLDKVVGIQLELPIIKLYESTWRLTEALDHMERLGFVPSQITPVNCHPEDAVSFVEVDTVFRRINPKFD